MYRVVFYCPDKHIEYDGRTPYDIGVGGGVTSRVRMARALARAGNQVKMVVNCPKQALIDGVEYIPLRYVQGGKSDVILLNSSGGAFDLTPASQLDMETTLKIIWISGKTQPEGIDLLTYDFAYVKSNFLRNHVENEWNIPGRKIFVAYNGFDEDIFQLAYQKRYFKDPHRLIYASHPVKGLDTAISILRRLRRSDSRLHLVVCGGPKLWGQPENEIPPEPGMYYLGLIGQRKLAEELIRSSYSLNLQDIEEGFGMVVTESMRAGCVVIASPVGAYKELICNGKDGIIIEGDHRSDDARDRAVEIIFSLSNDSEAQLILQRNARAVIWDCDRMAKTWMGHWDWWFERHGEVRGNMIKDYLERCSYCMGNLLPLADGHHCVRCGSYFRYQQGSP